MKFIVLLALQVNLDSAELIEVHITGQNRDAFTDVLLSISCYSDRQFLLKTLTWMQRLKAWMDETYSTRSLVKPLQNIFVYVQYHGSLHLAHIPNFTH